MKRLLVLVLMVASIKAMAWENPYREGSITMELSLTIDKKLNSLGKKLSIERQYGCTISNNKCRS